MDRERPRARPSAPRENGLPRQPVAYYTKSRSNEWNIGKTSLCENALGEEGVLQNPPSLEILPL